MRSVGRLQFCLLLTLLGNEIPVNTHTLTLTRMHTHMHAKTLEQNKNLRVDIKTNNKTTFHHFP